jgi:alpha-beta hydrolase superfamily lysophospholipase
MSATVSDSTLSTYTASAGENLAVQDWPLASGERLRGVVLLVHGLGEHAWRYDHVAQRLNDWGFAVRGYDQYGHGDSDGMRGALPTPTRLVDDLADLVDSTRARLQSGTPLIVLGHSMGGLVASTFAAIAGSAINGLVLTSPVLDPGLTGFQKLLLAALPKIAPNLAVSNGLDPAYLSHDPAVVAAYKADPRVHDRITGRLARFIADGGPWVLERAARWTVPTLLMYAGDDHLVNPAGSRAFAAAAPKNVLTAHCFDHMYHELFNELDAEPVFTMLKQWLDARFP